MFFLPYFGNDQKRLLAKVITLDPEKESSRYRNAFSIELEFRCVKMVTRIPNVAKQRFFIIPMKVKVNKSKVLIKGSIAILKDFPAFEPDVVHVVFHFNPAIDSHRFNYIPMPTCYFKSLNESF